MASPITVIKSHGIDITGDYVVNSISSSGNVSAGNIKTNHLLYANGTPYVFTTNAAGQNTQIQFNDSNNFAGSANLTFDKTTGTLTANFFVGDGSGLTGLPASYTDSDANAAIDARVTKSFVDNLGVNASTLGGHSASYFATSTQGNLADTAVQPGDNVSDLVNDAGYLVAANLSGYATESYVGNAVANLINSAPGVLDTLGEIANAIGNDASFITTINNELANKADTADLSNVALTGNYEDLNNLPTLFDGEYSSLANKPTLFSGSYTDLTNKPSIPTKTSDLTNDSGFITTVDFSGYATESYVGNAVANLVNSAPAALDTLSELANALGNDASYSTTITNALANKLSTSAFTSTADTWLATKSTTNIAEGTNQYYTVTRANSAIDARVTKTFVETLGANANVANTALSVDGANVTGQVANSLVAGTVYTNAQPNITSVGTLTSLNVTGSVSAGNIKSDHLLYANGTAYTLASFTNDSGFATQTDVSNAVANLVNSAPSTLDTLQELANALGNDASYSTTITNALANKLSTNQFTSTADTWLATKSTSNVAEGTNLYYTVDRANTAIDNRVTKSFVENLGANANVANVANSVAVANVTGIGNIATINTDGNASNVLYGNGVFASAPVTYANSNVQSYLPTYTGNLSPGNLIVGVDNLKVSGGTSGYVLTTDGSGNLSWAEQTGGSGSGGGESTVTSVDTFTGDGTTTDFTLSVTPQTISQTFVNYNGALQLRNAYTLSGAVMSFSEAPANGSQIEVTTQMNVTSGSGSLTVRNYTADGVQTTYSVSSGVNATNILVTENGLLQTPTVDYTVSGSTLTFIQAPGYGVKIQIRELGVAVATITPVGSNTQVLFNDAGSFGNSSGLTYNKTNSTLTVGNVVVSSYVGGNLIPSANITYNLGSDTKRWKDLYLSGNTIDLAGAQIKSDPTTGSIAFVPPATVATPNPTALVISPSGSLTTSVTTNGILDSNAFTSALTTGTVYSPRYISMVTTGTLSETTGTVRYYPPSNIQIRGTTASLSSASTSTFTFLLKKNGTTVGTYSISANQYLLTPSSANISLTTSDYLTVDITASSGASDLRIDLEYTVV